MDKWSCHFYHAQQGHLVRCFSCACWIPAIFGDQLFSVLLSPINCVYMGGKVKVGIRQERDNETFLRVLLEKAENHTESNEQHLSHEGWVTIDVKGKEDWSAQKRPKVKAPVKVTGNIRTFMFKIQGSELFAAQGILYQPNAQPQFHSTSPSPTQLQGNEWKLCKFYRLYNQTWKNKHIHLSEITLEFTQRTCGSSTVSSGEQEKQCQAKWRVLAVSNMLITSAIHWQQTCHLGLQPTSLWAGEG